MRPSIGSLPNCRCRPPPAPHRRDDQMVHGSQGLPPARYDQEVGFCGRSERTVSPDEHAAEVHNLRGGRDRHAHLWDPDGGSVFEDLQRGGDVVGPAAPVDDNGHAYGEILSFTVFPATGCRAWPQVE